MAHQHQRKMLKIAFRRYSDRSVELSLMKVERTKKNPVNLVIRFQLSEAKSANISGDERFLKLTLLKQKFWEKSLLFFEKKNNSLMSQHGV